MTTHNQHLILRQVLELELASASQAIDLQEEAARPFREAALPAVEELFDRVAGPDRIVRFDRLELDLGDLVGPAWREQLQDRLVAGLRESLEAETPHAGGASEPRPPFQTHSAGDAAFSEFLYFLARGRLPWWGRKPRGSWNEELPLPLRAEQWKSLGDLIRHDRRARCRLVAEVNDRFLAELVEAVGGPSRADEVGRLLAPGPVGDPAARSWRGRFWQLVTSSAVGDRTLPPPGPSLLGRLLAEREARSRRISPASEARSPHMPLVEIVAALAAAPSTLPPPWRAWLETLEEARPPPSLDVAAGEAASETKSAEATLRPPTDPSAGEVRAGADPGSPATEAATPEPPPHPGDATARGERPSPKVPPDSRAVDAQVPRPAEDPGLPWPQAPQTGYAEVAVDAEAVHVAGAGVVVLHPFLEELFASRGLLEDRLLRDDGARGHAVHLLAHLTFGDGEAAEYELLLAKTLCSMPWEEPLPASELTSEDRHDCDQLLAAVVGHWQALKSTSPQWLREQFLLRDGRLEPVDGGWKLTVNRQAQDVLLARIPWGIGFIRLPWMPELLYVSWAE